MNKIIYSDIKKMLKLPFVEQKKVFLDISLLLKIVNSFADCPTLLSHVNFNVSQKNTID